METQQKSNPIINFIRALLEKLGNTALFSILRPNSSATMGDEYLNNKEDLNKYTQAAADEIGMSRTRYKATKEAFDASKGRIDDLIVITSQGESKKSIFDPGPQQPEEVQ